MKILYIAYNLTIPVGGAEITSINLINALRNSGHICYTITNTNLNDFSCLRKFVDSDIIITQLNWTPYGEQVACLLNKPLVYMAHSYEHICSKGGYPSITAFCSKECSNCELQNKNFKPDLVIANSNYFKSVLEDQFNYKTEVVYPSIDFSNFNNCRAIDGPILMSRVSFVKGFDILNNIASKMPSLQFNIVGYKDFEPVIVNNNINIIGQQHYGSMYNNVSLLVSPFRTETYGMTIVEAQVAGLPVVVSNRCAVKHDNIAQYGFVVDDINNIDEWVQKITEATTFKDEKTLSYIKESFIKRHLPSNNAELLVKHCTSIL